MRVLCGVAALVVALAVSAAPAPAREQTDEYRVKAAFLLHFARLVTWPAQAFGDAPDSSLTIGVFAEDPFDGTLRELAEGETVDGRALRVREVPSVAQARRCQMLFVPASHADRVEELRSGLEGAPVLMVGESDGFAARGGSINFYLEEDRIRFEVNREAAERSGLRLSSRLLRLARLVSSEGL